MARKPGDSMRNTRAGMLQLKTDRVRGKEQ